jgi:ligand-binding sensor domain-containing protein
MGINGYKRIFIFVYIASMKSRGALLLILTFIFHCGYSQYLNMEFIDPFDKIKISNKNINCIVQDSMGFTWIATRNGLNRFDGYDLKLYQHNYLDKRTILGYDVKTLFCDSKGRLWVGGMTGLCLYDPLNDHFIRLASQSDSLGLKDLYIVQVNEDRDKKLYIANNMGVYVLDEGLNEFKPVFLVNKGKVSSFLFDQDNNLWIGTMNDGGLVHVNMRNGLSKEFFHDPLDPNSISDNSPVSLALQQNLLWIATTEGGINCLDIHTGRFKTFKCNNQFEKMSGTYTGTLTTAYGP